MTSFSSGPNSQDRKADTPASFDAIKEKIAISINNNVYHHGEAEESLPAVKEGAQTFQQLLKERYGYEMLPETFFGPDEPFLENKSSNLMGYLSLLLEKWKARQGKGATVDRLVLYYHGHGVEVLGQPCLLTPDMEVIPMVELINMVADHVISDRYYIITDCCANKESVNETDKKRVEEALGVHQHKGLVEKIVNIRAVPGGYKASSVKEKTLTSALVSVLEKSEKGIPLRKLKEKLREEQATQGSRNHPDVNGSFSEGVDDLFPL